MIRGTLTYFGVCAPYIDYKQSAYQTQGQMNHSSSFGHYSAKVKDPGALSTSTEYEVCSFSPPAIFGCRTFFYCRTEYELGEKRGHYLLSIYVVLE